MLSEGDDALDATGPEHELVGRPICGTAAVASVRDVLAQAHDVPDAKNVQVTGLRCVRWSPYVTTSDRPVALMVAGDRGGSGANG